MPERVTKKYVIHLFHCPYFCWPNFVWGTCDPPQIACAVCSKTTFACSVNTCWLLQLQQKPECTVKRHSTSKKMWIHIRIVLLTPQPWYCPISSRSKMVIDLLKNIRILYVGTRAGRFPHQIKFWLSLEFYSEVSLKQKPQDSVEPLLCQWQLLWLHTSASSHGFTDSRIHRFTDSRIHRFFKVTFSTLCGDFQKFAIWIFLQYFTFVYVAATSHIF